MPATIRSLATLAVMTCVAAIASSSALAEPNPTSVGLVTDIGGLNDRGFNSLANTGLGRAQNELGISATVLETKRYADFGPNFDTMAKSGAGLIFGAGFLASDALKAVAGKAPDAKFAIIDYSYQDGTEWTASTNVTSIVFDARQAGYLAGALAGVVEVHDGVRTNKARVVSAIGGQRIPEVTTYITGFRDGVHRTCKKCRVLTSYSNDFFASAKCRAIARNQIKAGSDIVFAVAGGCGLGALAEAKAKGVWAVGSDTDQHFFGSYVLTSATKRVDIAVLDVIRRSLNGTLTGGADIRYGVKENAVSVGVIAKAAKKYAPVVAAARRDLISGQVK